MFCIQRGLIKDMYVNLEGLRVGLQVWEVTKPEKESGGAFGANAARGSIVRVVTD